MKGAEIVGSVRVVSVYVGTNRADSLRRSYELLTGLLSRMELSTEVVQVFGFLGEIWK